MKKYILLTVGLLLSLCVAAQMEPVFMETFDRCIDDETNDNKYVTVQISGNARATLNVVDNPELIGQIVKVQGLLLNDNANPYYLGKPGVRDVRTDAQYVRPSKTQGVESVNCLDFNGEMYDILGRPVGDGYRGVIIQNGHKFIR